MKKDTRNTNSNIQYNFYMEQLRKAENPHTIYVGIAVNIGNCKEYTKTEKGKALETLTKAWIDFYENR